MMDIFTEAFDVEHLHLNNLTPVRFDMEHARICARVPCGTPAPIFSQVQGKLLSEYLSRNPKMTFLFEVTGDSMVNAGIHAGDVVVVDCRLEAQHGNIVLAEVNGEITLKRLQMIPNKRTKTIEMALIPDNPRHPPVKLSDFDDVHIFGVATRKMRIEELL